VLDAFSGSGTTFIAAELRTAWWRTQSYANPSLLPISLLTGKRTGNIVKSWLRERQRVKIMAS
jgi:hypothetical protein